MRHQATGHARGRIEDSDLCLPPARSIYEADAQHASNALMLVVHSSNSASQEELATVLAKFVHPPTIRWLDLDSFWLACSALLWTFLGKTPLLQPRWACGRLSVTPTAAKKLGDVLPIWERSFEVTSGEVDLFRVSQSFLFNALTTSPAMPLGVRLGPIAWLHHYCSAHANCARVDAAVVEVLVPIGQGEALSAAVARPPIEGAGPDLSPFPVCFACPYRHDSTDPSATKAWERDLHDRTWLLPCMAADWARINILAGIAEVPPHKLALHLGGPFRHTLLSHQHPWQRVRAILEGPLRERVAALERAFHSSLPTPAHIDPPAFWRTVLRYADAVHWEGGSKRRKAPLAVYWHRDRGLGIRSRRAYLRVESVVQGLWGEVHDISRDYSWLQIHDTAITHSLVSGSGVPHTLLCTLGLLNHSCEAHANVVPERPPTRRRGLRPA